MHSDMSQKTKKEVMVRLGRFYAKAGPDYKRQLLNQAIGLFGYHRKAAIRALRARPTPRQSGPAVILGRPREYGSERLLPVLKPIWFGALQPCGHRLHALLPEWLPAYEADHHRIDADVRKALLAASARTLDRLVSPLRSKAGRRGGTRPGSLLRQSIPIRGAWEEEGPGWVEVDTVALCGGTLDDRHLWMLDAVDIRTDWTEQRALENRGQHCTLAQIRDLENSLPFALRGLDSDNGGEFINHHLVQYLHQRKKPVLLTRARPCYEKGSQADSFCLLTHFIQNSLVRKTLIEGPWGSRALSRWSAGGKGGEQYLDCALDRQHDPLRVLPLLTKRFLEETFSQRVAASQRLNAQPAIRV
jgi:hypothetical protein